MIFGGGGGTLDFRASDEEIIRARDPQSPERKWSRTPRKTW